MAESHRIPTSPKFRDLTGKRFGRLTVISFGGYAKKLTKWKCRCDCGTETVVQSGNLSSGTTTSCGCYRREFKRTHGASGAARHGVNRSEYNCWASMFQRCENPANTNYRHYGGRGIKVCDRWRDFANFIADMGKRPTPKHTIDRIDNNGHYEPGNCRWITQAEQMNNTRRNVYLEHNGQRMTVTQWAEQLGTLQQIISGRLMLGWSVADAVTKPIHIDRVLEHDGKTMTINEWETHLGFSRNVVRGRLKLGWSVHDALTTPKEPRKPQVKRTTEAAS